MAERAIRKPRVTTTDSPILSDKLYVPKHLMNEKLLVDALRGRFTYYVDGEDGEKEAVYSWENTRRYHVFNRGNRKKIQAYFDIFKPFRDRTSKTKMETRLEFTSTLYAEQQRCLEQWLRKGYGILEAPTGWGKSVVVIALLCRLQLKTLILVSQKDHCNTWLEEIYKHTNAEVLDRTSLGGTCGIYNTRSRLVYPCITVATYQSFIHSASSRWYDQNRDIWGILWVDECDQTGADAYSKVAARSRASVKGGCTATPRRNDGLEHLVFDIVGPVTAKSDVTNMDAHVTMVRTDVFIPPMKGTTKEQWGKALSFLTNSDKYYKIVRDLILHDADRGRFILVASRRNNILHMLYEDICNLPSMNGRVRLLTGDTSKEAREEIIAKARTGDVVITLAQERICTRNLNVPLWDCLHRITPCAGWTRGRNRQPNTQITQPIGRIVRILRDEQGNIIDKPTPLVRHYTFTGMPMFVAIGRGVSSAYSTLGHRVESISAAEAIQYADVDMLMLDDGEWWDAPDSKDDNDSTPGDDDVDWSWAE